MRHFILSLLLTLASAAVVSAQSDYYYYDSDGTPIYLDVFDSLVAVRFDPSHGGTAQSFSIEQPMLVDDVEFEFIGNRTHIFRIEPGISLAQAMFGLRLQQDVAMVNPVAYNRYGGRWKMNNQLLVTYNQSSAQYEIDTLEISFGVSRVEVIDDSLRMVVLDYNQTTPFDITKIARDYFNTGLCLAVEPVITFAAYPASNDPYYSLQYQLDNVGQEGGTVDADIDWSESDLYQGPSMTYPVVALIDGGFEQIHEDLPTPWYTWPYDATGELVDQTPPDNDPWNECTGSDPTCWHGTAVLGVLKAATGNAIGLAGTENRPFVMPIKIIDAHNNTNARAIGRGLTWARQPHGGVSARIVCVTWLFPGYVSPSINNVLKSCYDAGKAVVVAAGNDGEVDYPANSPYVLAVGMSDRNDARADNSGAGPALDILAPGKNVWTLDLMGAAGLSPFAVNCDGNPNYMCNQTGTSFAAPLVASIIAKMYITNPWFMGPQQQPQSAEYIYEIIRHSADRELYGGGDGRVNDLVGWGRVNADKAVLIVKRGDANNDGQVNISDAITILNFIFNSGEGPQPQLGTGEVNCTGNLNISDAVYLIDYIFAGGAPPMPCL